MLKASALFIALVGCCNLLPSLQADTEKPVISIIIDDLGYNLTQAKQAMQLPVEVTFSILPYTPYSITVSRHAANQGREYMLHLPMESTSGINNDPGMLTVAMQKHEFQRSLDISLSTLKGYAGVNNHKGSALTANESKMDMLLKTLSAKKNIYFVDSKTTAASKTKKMAARYGVPYAARNVFLDVDVDEEKIAAQFELLKHIARKKGAAIGIAHPHKTSLLTLKRLLTEADSNEFVLLPVSE